MSGKLIVFAQTLNEIWPKKSGKCLIKSVGHVMSGYLCGIFASLFRKMQTSKKKNTQNSLYHV